MRVTSIFLQYYWLCFPDVKLPGEINDESVWILVPPLLMRLFKIQLLLTMFLRRWNLPVQGVVSRSHIFMAWLLICVSGYKWGLDAAVQKLELPDFPQLIRCFSMTKHTPMHDFLLPRSQLKHAQYSQAKYLFSIMLLQHFVLQVTPVAPWVCTMNTSVRLYLGRRDTLIMIVFSSMLSLNSLECRG